MMLVSHWSSRSAFTIALWKVVFNTSDNPRCGTTAVSNLSFGIGVCHQWKPWCRIHWTLLGSDLLLVFTGKANLNASSQAQVTRGGFFQLFAVDLFTKYSATWFG